jgi:hypothetical protein
LRIGQERNSLTTGAVVGAPCYTGNKTARQRNARVTPMCFSVHSTRHFDLMCERLGRVSDFRGSARHSWRLAEYDVT